MNHDGSQYDAEALDAVREKRLLMPQVDEWLFRLVAPHLGQRVLEIGSGHGNFVRLMLDRERVVATDVDPRSVHVLAETFAGQLNVVCEVADITSPSCLALARHEVDSIVTVNVFEHIEEDERALGHAAAILPSGGTLAIVVPAHERLYGAMDSAIGHWRRYTKASLGARLERAGFRVEVVRYVNVIGGLGWWLNGRVLGRHVPPDGQLGAINRFVPLLESLESRFEPPGGVSVLAVASR